MDMDRYARITRKRPREIVLLQGHGCTWRKCTFCDYHHDSNPDPQSAFALNEAVLTQVTGEFGELEVINSGSVFELDEATLELIASTCADRGIHTLHFESHWLYRHRIPELRRSFAPVKLKMKLGLETFDANLREGIWMKGIDETDPTRIAEGFDEANLLVGVAGQTVESMQRDIELALSLFDRVCVNVMCENTSDVRPDPQVIAQFMEKVHPQIEDDPRIDCLVENTDFGVGSTGKREAAAA